MLSLSKSVAGVNCCLSRQKLSDRFFYISPGRLVLGNNGFFLSKAMFEICCLPIDPWMGTGTSSASIQGLCVKEKGHISTSCEAFQIPPCWHLINPTEKTLCKHSRFLYAVLWLSDIKYTCFFYLCHWLLKVRIQKWKSVDKKRKKEEISCFALH